MARGDALAAVEELRVTKIRLSIFVLLFIFSSAFDVVVVDVDVDVGFVDL